MSNEEETDAPPTNIASLFEPQYRESLLYVLDMVVKIDDACERHMKTHEQAARHALAYVMCGVGQLVAKGITDEDVLKFVRRVLHLNRLNACTDLSPTEAFNRFDADIAADKV